MARIGFVLLSGTTQPVPSTRVAVLNMLPLLEQAGHEVHLLYAPETPLEQPDVDLDPAHIAARGFDLVCFQKVHGAAVQALVRGLSAHGVATLYLVCDLVLPEMVALCTATAVVTDFLRSLYPLELQPRMAVVHDGIEREEVEKTCWRDQPASAAHPLHAVLVTSADMHRLPLPMRLPDWLRVTVVGRYTPQQTQDRWSYLRANLWRLRQTRSFQEAWQTVGFALHPRIQRVAWHAQRVYQQLQEADIAIIPAETDQTHRTETGVPVWMVKSENRLTLAMAVGLPAVVTPIPAYCAVVQHGVNGYLAFQPEQWRDALQALRDPAHRRSVGAAARRTAMAGYSQAMQFKRLSALIERCLDWRAAQRA